MTLEDAFKNVTVAARELMANADTHDKISESLNIIEVTLFPEKFTKKDNLEAEANNN